MYCSNCGKQISNDDAFCPSCGARTAPFQPSVTVVRDNVAQPMSQPTYTPPAPQPVAQPTYAQPVRTAAPAADKTNTIGIVGFIMAFIIPIAGLVCSIIGYKNAKNGSADNKGLALAGIIISAIELASGVLGMFVYFFYIIIMLGIFGSISSYSMLPLIVSLGGLLI